MAKVDKIQTTNHDQAGLLGEVPANLLGPDRTAAVVKKLKGKKMSALRAKDSNVRMDKSNIEKATDALSHFVNKR